MPAGIDTYDLYDRDDGVRLHDFARLVTARVTADGQSKLVNGAGTNTFPTYVSSMTKHSKNLPSVFALSTLMLLFTCTLVGLSKLLTAKNQTKLKGKSE